MRVLVEIPDDLATRVTRDHDDDLDAAIVDALQLYEETANAEELLTDAEPVSLTPPKVTQ